MKVLVINCGSSSLKYQLFDMQTEKSLAKGICEAIGTNASRKKGSVYDGRSFFEQTPIPTHRAAFDIVKETLTSGECKIIDDLSEIDAIGHRGVLGGRLFDDSVLVNDEILKAIETLIPLAPIHTPVHIEAIEACRNLFGKDVPQVAVFDNAFHKGMPETSYMFALPYEFYEKHHIRRYGAHGSSHRFVADRTAELLGKELSEIKLITCHLGGGASIAAIKNGHVLDTSMGFTPIDGFMMATRCGAVDPSVITYIMQKHNLTAEEMDNIMNNESGILGISGLHSDYRVVREAASNGHKRAKLAIDMQRYQIIKTVGSYIAAMDGIDAITFTGGIGENSSELRSEILSNFSYLGMYLDAEANKICGKEVQITLPDCRMKAFVVPTNEELAIARETVKIMNSSEGGKDV